MWNIIQKTLNLKVKPVHFINFKYKLHGKPPGIAKTFKERLEQMNYKDPEIYFKIDIGLPPPKKETKMELYKKNKYLINKKSDSVLERASRTLTLKVDLDDVTNEWYNTVGPMHIYKVAEHYGIYNDLFGDAYFIPYVPLQIGFPQPNDLEAPVYRGNVVKPAEASVEPNVFFESEKNIFWTLVLTNPDGHFTEDKMEYVHWFVGNIPGNDISKGDVIWDYLPPFPSRGIGFQRLIFILYKQDKKIDYSLLKKKLPCLELKDRSFNTLEFYRERQDYITPAGLLFFQSDWDYSVIKTFHEKLNMEEPIFEYDHDVPYINKQEWFPKRKPFNLYIDRYRDPRDIAKDYLLKKVEKLNPFEQPEKPFPYLDYKSFSRDEPTWLVDLKIRNKTGRGRIADQNEDEYE